MIRVLNLVSFFSCKIPRKMVLVFCPCAVRLRRLAQNVGRGLRLRPFTCKFVRKMVVVTCPCAFRPGKLAQNACRGLGAGHFP